MNKARTVLLTVSSTSLTALSFIAVRTSSRSWDLAESLDWLLSLAANAAARAFFFFWSTTQAPFLFRITGVPSLTVLWRGCQPLWLEPCCLRLSMKACLFLAMRSSSRGFVQSFSICGPPHLKQVPLGRCPCWALKAAPRLPVFHLDCMPWYKVEASKSVSETGGNSSRLFCL